MTVTVGEVFSKRHVFTAEDISDFARRAGDLNPLHHDAQKAASSRFGGLIASGSQTSALLMALAAHLSKEHDTVGLDFSFRFRRAVPAGTDALLSWEIVSIEPNPKLGGDVLAFKGQIVDDAGTRYLSAEGRAVIWPLGHDAARRSKE
jgi:acyl dehydratase